MFPKNTIATIAASLSLLLLVGCATLPQNFQRPESFAYTDTEDTTLGRSRAGEEAAHSGESGFRMLGDGLDAFVARLVLANAAERSIDAQYYLYHDDLTGRLFTDALLRAADRGVRVRLLLDDMDFQGRDAGLAAMDAYPNVDIRIFNPFSRNTGRLIQFITRFGDVTRRMHNKSFTVDNQATIFGGRNIGDAYFSADPELAFSDLDVLAIGPVVQKVSDAFDLYWNSDQVYPVSVLIDNPPTAAETAEKRKVLDDFVAQQMDSVYIQALRDSGLANQMRARQVELSWGEAHIVYDQPEKVKLDRSQTAYHMSSKLRPYFEALSKDLTIFSPYFVPGERGTRFLTQLVERGVRVRILTNSLESNDVAAVHAGYAKYRKALLRGGVEIFEMNKKLSREQRKQKKKVGGSSKASLHAKSFVFDRQQLFIGSLNLDPRSIAENTEIGVVVTSPDMSDAMVDWFDQNVEQIAFRLILVKGTGGSERIVWQGLVDGKPKRFDVEPYSSFWKRLSVDLMGLFPIESQL